MYFCVFITFLHVIKWGSIAQVSSSWTSLARGARSYTRGASYRSYALCVGVHMSVENICLLRIYACVCVR